MTKKNKITTYDNKKGPSKNNKITNASAGCSANDKNNKITMQTMPSDENDPMKITKY